MSKKFLFLDYSGNDLAFAEICAAQQSECQIVNSSDDLVSALDTGEFDAVFLDLSDSDKFDLTKLKVPGTVFICAKNKLLVDPLIKKILFTNPEFRLIVNEFEPGISSNFANLVKSI
jgi:hypothetical protein